ncbi:hypothetical protein [Thermofilum pendens]|uniref:Uncharacterized protein n=1 Tax=Thermofilum pendens (strain DSM 2475 / Hrk 5) TaxID=368408 RepID=A1RXB5_THEPD|nr:hypothetical protein [Thermofilum pendens]ABL77845.1 hypothetical protein Tpen_0436 [Thermofilum pendens Hrk 5]
MSGVMKVGIRLELPAEEEEYRSISVDDYSGGGIVILHAFSRGRIIYAVETDQRKFSLARSIVNEVLRLYSMLEGVKEELPQTQGKREPS